MTSFTVEFSCDRYFVCVDGKVLCSYENRTDAHDGMVRCAAAAGANIAYRVVSGQGYVSAGQKFTGQI